MSDIIYENKAAALAACRSANTKILEVLREYSIREECEDSCVSTYLVARYRDEQGHIREYHCS